MMTILINSEMTIPIMVPVSIEILATYPDLRLNLNWLFSTFTCMSNV
jgi:hypothetical protein